MGEDAGNVFVHRNVANLVVNSDPNLLSALQYGVAYLKVKDIIVCGHYECGGMRAAESANDHVAPLEQWLRNARDVYRIHKEELDAIQDADARHRRFVELNVIEQCMNVMKTGVVQKTRKENYLNEGEILPRIHAMVFDPKTGDLKRIPVSIQHRMRLSTGLFVCCTRLNNFGPSIVFTFLLQFDFTQIEDNLAKIYGIHLLEK